MPRSPASPSTASEPPQGDRYRAVGRLIKQVFQSLVRRIDQRMQPLELTAMQWEPLLLLFNHRVDTVAALARESQVNCGAMTRMLDRLEQKELLRRQRSEQDRRVVNLQLTEKGQTVGKDLLPLVRKELQRHLSDFTDEEISTLIGFLNRMLKNGAQDA
jgi:DNA-binding MarR family transcriptional regulator